MCLTIPQKVQKIEDNVVYIDDKKPRKVKIGFSETVKKGDWVLVNADLAVSKVTEKEAEEINNLFIMNPGGG